MYLLRRYLDVLTRMSCFDIGPCMLKLAVTFHVLHGSMLRAQQRLSSCCTLAKVLVIKCDL